MADVDDRWTKLDRATGERVRTGRWGTGKRWASRWRDHSGRQRSRSFEKKTDAETFLSNVLADLSRGTYVDPAAGRVTFRAYAERWAKAQTSDPVTRKAVAQRLKSQVYPTLGDTELVSLLPSTIQAWVAGLSTDHAPGTVRVTLRTASTILSAAVEDRLIPRNPCKSSAVRPPAAKERLIVPWTVQRVRAVADGMPGQYAAMVYAGAGVGLRQGELFGLAVDAVDFLARTVHVIRQVKVVDGKPYLAPPKRGKTRDVPLPASMGLELAEHIRQHGTTKVTLLWLPTGKPVTVSLLFTTDAGTALDKSTFTRRAWRPALKAAGVPIERTNGMHALRHAYASALLADGVDIRTLAGYLGHTDPGFTLRTYCHLLTSAEDRARHAIDTAFSAGGAPDVRQQAR